MGKFQLFVDFIHQALKTYLFTSQVISRGLNPERQAIRIGAAVGNRKRANIHDRADDLGLRVLNRRNVDRKGDLQ